MTAITTTGRTIDQAAFEALSASYQELRRYGTDSVRAAWNFGQLLDHFLAPITGYTQGMLAQALGISVGTVKRYLKLYEAYQRADLAVDASKALQTYDVGIITALRDDLRPVEHARPYAGRRYQYRCNSCHGTDVAREELDPETLQPLAEAVAG